MCKLLRAHAFKISSFSTFCAVFSCILTGNKMISLAIWCNRHLKSFQRLQIVLAHLLVQFCCLLLMLVNNKSCTWNRGITYTNCTRIYGLYNTDKDDIDKMGIWTIKWNNKIVRIYFCFVNIVWLCNSIVFTLTLWAPPWSSLTDFTHALYRAQ